MREPGVGRAPSMLEEMRSVPALACALVALLGACGGSAPASLGGATSPPASRSASPSPAATRSAGAPPVSRSPSPTVRPSPDRTDEEPPEFVTIGAVDDPGGDAGREARAYNDLLGVRIQDDGSHARILVRLAAPAPNPMPEDAQMGISVDLYATAEQQESDYQIFAAGTDEGWEAFLQTPDGFVAYPEGAFEFFDDGEIVGFTLPWSMLDDRRSGRFAAVLDWDREAIAIGLAGQDRAPDRGRTRYAA